MKTTTLSKTAAAVVLAMASLGAQAAEVTLKFDALSTSINDPANPRGAGAPIAVGTSQSGFLFSGAFAYDFTVQNAFDARPDNAPPSEPVYIANQDRGGSAGVIELSLLGANAGRAFKTVAFNYFVGQSTPTIEVFGAGADPLHTFTFTPGNGPKPWLSSGDLDLSAYAGANRLKFSGSNSGLLGLDSIAIDFISGSTGPGGNVPEPASFGLVALALLGAGFARRRIKQA